MQNPSTFLPCSYFVLFRQQFSLKANHSATNVDIADTKYDAGVRKEGQREVPKSCNHGSVL